MAVDTPKANGLKTVVDTIIAPKEAFEAIRVVPTWGWALLIAIVLSMISGYFFAPALIHAYPGTFAQQAAVDPRMQNMSSDQQQAMIAFTDKIFNFSWIGAVIYVPFATLIAAVVLLIFDKIGRGEGSFGKYWAAACNISIPTLVLGGIISTVIVLVRGADSFGTMQAIQQATPSLAMVVPGAGTKLTAFLSAITPFSLWGVGLNVAAMRIIGRAAPFSAWLAALILLLVPALLASTGAK